MQAIVGCYVSPLPASNITPGFRHQPVISHIFNRPSMGNSRSGDNPTWTASDKVEFDYGEECNVLAR